MNCRHPEGSYQFLDLNNDTNIGANKTYIICGVCGAVSNYKKEPTFMMSVGSNITNAAEVEDDETEDVHDDLLCQGGCGGGLSISAVRAGRDVCFSCYKESFED